MSEEEGWVRNEAGIWTPPAPRAGRHEPAFVVAGFKPPEKP